MIRLLYISQVIFVAAAFVLVSAALFGSAGWEYINSENAGALGIGLLLAAVAIYGPQVVHELAELNDQLAGRSTEFRSLLNEARGPQDD